MSLRKLRVMQDFTQAAVALRLKVSRPLISMIENGHVRPSRKMLEKLADMYKLPVSMLIEADKEEVDHELQ